MRLEVDLVASLLDPLTIAQRQLLAVVYEPFGREGRWPCFQYVEMTLDQAGLDDPTTLLASYPSWGPLRYGAVWYNRAGLPMKDTVVGLTVAGLFHVHKVAVSLAGTAHTVDTSAEQALFISGLAYLVQRQGSLTPQPFVPQDVMITSQEVADHLQVQPANDVRLRKLYELLSREPGLVGSSQGPNPPDGSWSVEPRRDVRRHKDVDSVPAYLERLSEELTVPAPQPTPVQRSSLNLLEAIDYLNAIWELRVGGSPLFRFARGVTTNRLAEPCATPEEFQSCLSSLSDVLKYRIDRHDAPLKRLRAFEGRLDAGGRRRVAGAIEVLEATISVRVAGQHGDASGRGAEALHKLGVGYPVLDWSRAWETIQDRTVAALNAVREEADATQGNVDGSQT